MPFAVQGLDPILTLFAWFGGVSVVAQRVLYLLTSVSVVVYFGRDRAGEPVWNTLISPIVAGVLMIAGISVAVANFETLRGGPRATAIVLLGSIVVVFVVGVVVEILRRPRRSAT